MWNLNQDDADLYPAISRVRPDAQKKGPHVYPFVFRQDKALNDVRSERMDWGNSTGDRIHLLEKKTWDRKPLKI